MMERRVGKVERNRYEKEYEKEYEKKSMRREIVWYIMDEREQRGGF